MDRKKSLLEVKNLSIAIKRFIGKEKVLLSSVEDISFEIFPGEIAGIVGESGSGKSLTALAISGLLGDNKEITNGSIILRGKDERDIVKLNENERKSIRGKEISMIFQEPFSSLNPLMKIGRQIKEALELHGERDKNINKKRIIEILHKMSLPEPHKLLENYPHRLSGGMCQRIMIAMALICRPSLLIADEPTTALDNNTQGEIISLLKEINKDFGTSILFISHDLSLVRDFCSRIMVMYSGRFLEEGDAMEVFNNPAHYYTKSLIGSIPLRENRGKDLNVISGRIPSLEEGRPSGCPFHPRCNNAILECKKDFPEKKLINKNHWSHCILNEQQ